MAHVRPRSWNYIGHHPKQFRHYGPIVQEFHNAFDTDGVRTIGSPTTINSGDIAGILTVGVQALAKENASPQNRTPNDRFTPPP